MGNFLRVYLFYIFIGVFSRPAGAVPDPSQCNHEFEKARNLRPGQFQVIQLTSPEAGHPEMPDPSAPYLASDGTVHLYGSGGHYLEFPGGLTQLTLGNVAHINYVNLPLYYPDGLTPYYFGEYHEGDAPWDGGKVNWGAGWGEIYYGGAMVAPAFRKNAESGAAKTAHNAGGDNWTRSSTAFVKKRLENGKEIWIQQPTNIFGQTPVASGEDYGAWHSPGWNHNYGTKIIMRRDGTIYRDDAGRAWVTYERVIEQKIVDGKVLPWLTQAFARPMINPLRAAGDETEVVLIKPRAPDGTAYPSCKRECGGLLIEGPQVIEIEALTPEGEKKWVWIISVSGGEFYLPTYGIILGNQPAGKGPIAEYAGITERRSDGVEDLKDFGSPLRTQLGLTQGPGRATFFSGPIDRKKNLGDFMLYHGSRKKFRSLFLTPIQWRLTREGQVYFTPGRVER